MISKNGALVTAGVVFMLVAVLHLVRFIMKMQIIAGGKEIPLRASIGGFLIAGLLGIWMFAAAKQK